jgi:hypothetical protein
MGLRRRVATCFAAVAAIAVVVGLPLDVPGELIKSEKFFNEDGNVVVSGAEAMAGVVLKEAEDVFKVVRLGVGVGVGVGVVVVVGVGVGVVVVVASEIVRFRARALFLLASSASASGSFMRGRRPRFICGASTQSFSQCFRTHCEQGRSESHAILAFLHGLQATATRFDTGGSTAAAAICAALGGV